MNPIRKIRWIIGLGVVVYLIVNSIRESGPAYKDTVTSKDKIRQAADIVRMWKDGVWARSVPNLTPGQARQLLQDVIASQSEEATKVEARQLLNELDRRPFYLAFASRIAAFLPHIDEYLALEKLSKPGEASGEPLPGRFIVFAKRTSSDKPGDRSEPEVYFDAEMIEACGDGIAMSPDEVRAVICFASKREVVGNYKLKSWTIGDTKIDLDDPDQPGKRKRRAPEPYITGQAFRELCEITTRDYPSGRVLTVGRIGAIDPREVVQGGGVELAASARGQVRSKLIEYFQELAVSRP